MAGKTLSSYQRSLTTFYRYRGKVALFLSANSPEITRSRRYQHNEDNKKRSAYGSWVYTTTGAIAASATLYAFNSRRRRDLLSLDAKEEVKASSDKDEIIKKTGEIKPGLPQYRSKQIAEHDCMEKRIWVTFKNGVYDITDFIPKHPGAAKLMLAAGSSVEPFWALYAVHLNNAQVYELLEKYRIGNVHPDDVYVGSDSYDPFVNEPRRHKILMPSSLRPYNAEPPLDVLLENFLTPNDFFYIRNHLPVPEVDADSYELEVQGPGFLKKELSLSLEDLKKFPKYTVTATLQCGGNRRSEMSEVRPLKGLNWKGAAIGNATWGGARLYDVLKAAGLDMENEEGHIIFEGYDTGADGSAYAASIPLYKGIDPRQDVLLAYEMNGEELPQDHGYPVRAVIPGVVASRNVKWLARIVISEEESDSLWQRNDYKGFNPSVDWDNVDFSKAPSIQGVPVTSAICIPEPGTEVKAGTTVKVKGYAWSGSGSRIVRVDVTGDGGKTWVDAVITDQEKAKEPRHYGWTFWEADVPVTRTSLWQKEVEIWAKAVDSNYNVQPENFDNIWNLRGLLANAYFKLKLKLV